MQGRWVSKPIHIVQVAFIFFGRKAEGIFSPPSSFFPIFNEMDGHFCYKHRVTMLSGLPMVMDLEEINPFLVSLAKSPGSIFLCHSHIW